MKTLVIFFEELVVDTRTHVKAVDMRFGHDPHEIVISREIQRVQAKMMSVFALVTAEHISGRGDVGLATENGLDVHTGEIAVGLLLLRTAFVIEALEREEVSVIGYRQCGHAELTRLFDERHDLTLSVQQRIGRMKMKMNEI